MWLGANRVAFFSCACVFERKRATVVTLLSVRRQRQRCLWASVLSAHTGKVSAPKRQNDPAGQAEQEL